MKSLVLLGEGQGEVRGLPILIRRLLKERDPASELLYADKDVIRTHNAASLVTWDKEKRQPDFSEWIRFLKIAAKRPNMTSVLALFDGDDKRFPAGGPDAFCVSKAAQALSAAAVAAGAGKTFSLAVVFACIEYESWLIAGASSLAGKKLPDGRLALPSHVQTPADPESHGKGWLEKHHPEYRPARDQGDLTQMVDLEAIRATKIRSFIRLENGIAQLLDAAKTQKYCVTPS